MMYEFFRTYEGVYRIIAFNTGTLLSNCSSYADYNMKSNTIEWDLENRDLDNTGFLGPRFKFTYPSSSMIVW